MTDQERVKRLEEIFADQEFTRKTLEMETAEEVQQALKDKGVDLSVEEINGIWKGVMQQLESGEELGKEQLKNVGGGVAGILIFGGICTAITAAATAIGYTDKKTRGRW